LLSISINYRISKLMKNNTRRLSYLLE